MRQLTLLFVTAASAAHASGSTRVAAAGCGAVVDYVDCSDGFSNITQEWCEERGCCYGPAVDVVLGNSTCTYAADGVEVTTVHVITSNHFDAGYAGLTADVVNMYFDQFFPLAAKTGAALGMPLHWMTQSYLVSLFLDCPPGMKLHCPNSSALGNFKAAVAAGHIDWHAFPHNAELATADASLLRFGIQMTNDLNQRLGRPNATVLSDRDVPGMPRSAIPILKSAGVLAVSEGMNGRMVPVNVPPIFRWLDPATNTSVMALWHWDGYGSIGDPGYAVRAPGSEHALVYAWRGDNSGPPPAAGTTSATVAGGELRLHASDYPNTTMDLAKARELFPSASVVKFSTLDAFAAELQKTEQLLPIISKDLADTWIWGAPSDPLKVAKMRAWHRLRTACESGIMGPAINVECATAHSPEQPFYNASRIALKNIEHTWGISIWHDGGELDADWSNAAFHQQLTDKNQIFSNMTESWNEQRDWGFRHPMAALKMNTAGRRLAAVLEEEFAAMTPDAEPSPAKQGFTKLDPEEANARIVLGNCSIVVDQASGALSSFVTSAGDRQQPHEWAGPENLLIKLQYQTLVLTDFERWWEEYIVGSWNGSAWTDASHGHTEFGKPPGFMTGLPGNKSVTHRLVTPMLKSIWLNQHTGNAATGRSCAPDIHVIVPTCTS